MPNSFMVGDKIRLTKAMKAPSGIFTIPKGTKGKVTWASGDKYLIDVEYNGKISLQVLGREIEKTGFWAGR